MGDTRIDWADATWESVSGCTKVSSGYRNCYAERLADGRLKRFYPDGFGAVRTHPERLDIPLRWRKPRRIFVCSRSDLFHEAVPDEFIGGIFDTMSMAEQHAFLVLTKRPERMAQLVKRWYGPPKQPLSHVWLGVSVENQETADERIPLLLDTPAAVRFVSAEPLLASVDMKQWFQICPECVFKKPTVLDERSHCANCHGQQFGGSGLDWLIVGCESGKNARPMDEAWVRDIRDQCVAAGVPLFYKQAMRDGRLEHMPALDGRVWNEVPKP